MSFYNGNVGTWAIKQYGKQYRDLHEPVENGSVVIRNGKDIVRAIIKDSEITESRVYRNGRLTYAVKYGEYEKHLSDGKVTDIMRYQKGTAQGKHGLSVRRYVKLCGQEGSCYSFYSRGTLIWQKFTYSNGKVAYYARRNDTEVKAVYPNGAPLFDIKVSCLYMKGRECLPFIYSRHDRADENNYSADGVMCDYTFWYANGRVKEHGKYENNQRVGEWVKGGKAYFYLSGLPVPKALYHAKPEDIKAKEVLAIKNAQVRAMMLKKVGYERVVKECEGKVIDREGNYALIDFPVKYDKDAHFGSPDKVLRILKVVCPSTKGDYFLSIPPTPDFATIRSARNGTFTGFEPKAKEVQFAIET